MRIWRDEIEAGEFSWWDRDLNFGRPWEFGEVAGSRKQGWEMWWGWTKHEGW